MGETAATARSSRLKVVSDGAAGAGLDDFKYIHSKLKKCLYIYIGRTKTCGLGIFAAKPFKEREIIMLDEDGDYYNRVVSYRQLQELGYRLEITLQVGPDAFKLPTGSIDDFTNHSCDPNTGIRLTARGTVVVALRDIAVHEELTYDYSTYLNNPYESLRCRCGAPNCRGVVGNFNTLPEALRRRYLALGIVGAFVHEPLPRADAAD